MTYLTTHISISLCHNLTTVEYRAKLTISAVLWMSVKSAISANVRLLIENNTECHEVLKECGHRLYL